MSIHGLMFLSALAVAAPPAGLPVRVEAGVVYARAGDADLRLDVAVPTNGSGPWPMVLCLHGGAWRVGFREEFSRPNIVFGEASLIERLAARGYVVASASYRLAPKAKFPDMLGDAKAAVRWLRANADRLHGRPDRIAAMGISAGGHLACLVGLTRPEDGLEGIVGNPGVSSAVQAVVSFFGPTDFTLRTWSPAAEDSVYVPFLGSRFDADPAAYRRASPVSYVRRGAPPFLLVHGTADTVVDLSQSHTLADNLREVGVPARLIEVPGAGHGWFGGTLDKSVAWMVDFLDGTLRR
jgi:acetyl esterase/lipase